MQRFHGWRVSICRGVSTIGRSGTRRGRFPRQASPLPGGRASPSVRCGTHPCPRRSARRRDLLRGSGGSHVEKVSVMASLLPNFTSFPAKSASGAPHCTAPRRLWIRETARDSLGMGVVEMGTRNGAFGEPRRLAIMECDCLQSMWSLETHSSSNGSMRSVLPAGRLRWREAHPARAPRPAPGIQ